MPRLFQVSNATGALKVDEVFDFHQDDLIEEDVMLLDSYGEIFVWVGKLAHPEEEREAPKLGRRCQQTSP